MKLYEDTIRIVVEGDSKITMQHDEDSTGSVVIEMFFEFEETNRLYFSPEAARSIAKQLLRIADDVEEEVERLSCHSDSQDT